MTTHLTDTELRDFAEGSLAAADLLRADDHLLDCAECRRRGAALNHASSAAHEVSDALSSHRHHLSDEELQLVIAGAVEPAHRNTIGRHLSECAICSRQVEELSVWAAPSGRSRMRLVAIAAAILVGALIPAIVWQTRVVQRREAARSSAIPGFDVLPPAEQAQVRAALNDGVASLPDFMADITSPTETLMSGSKGASDAFVLTDPIGTATLSDRPRFDWQPLPDATEYVVTVFDELSKVVVRSSRLDRPGWSPSEPLPRGRTYIWQVAASRNGDVAISPKAPQPPAMFRVIDARTAETLQRVERSEPRSHVLLGVLNMNAGVRDEAKRQFQQVQPTDPRADVARRSLERLDAFAQRR